MGKKKTDKSIILTEEFILRPEQIIRYIENNGTLPDDFNPYGGYVPAEIKFLGDKPPQEGRYVILNNNDPDLVPVVISEPSPPPLSLINGYGESADEQYFKRLPFPEKLRGLYQKAFESLNDVQKRNYQETIQSYKLYLKYWEILEDNQEEFTDEIKYIKHIWWYRTYGYWFYNDGEPTYITGDYFDFLQHWYIAEAAIYPEFRDKDRKKYLFAQFIETTTETFEKIDKDTGHAIKEPDGTYKMIDLGRRTFFGDVEPKSRRGGATHQCVHKVWKGNSTTTGAYGTIISMEGRNAEKHYFKKLIPAWDKYPMFLKPIWTGNRRPNSIKMVEPPNVFGMDGLGSMIDYTDSAGVSANDGDRLNYILQDEMGKCFGYGTEIIMADGSIKQVQDITEGEYVMGDDGTPRHVYGCTRGREELFKISSKFGDFVCNKSHILSLRSSGAVAGCRSAGEIVNIPLADVMKFSYDTKRNLKLYRKPIFYHEQPLDIDPYIMGLWLGDGHSAFFGITNTDKEIIDCLYEFAEEHGYDIKQKQDIEYHFSKGSADVPLRTILKKNGVLNNKHIPEIYLKNSRHNRLQLLAGLIDTDGSREKRDNYLKYEITQKRKELAEGICELANGLGFYSSIKEHTARMKRKDGTVYSCAVYRVTLFGDLYDIPARIAKKKFTKPNGWRNKNPNVSWFKIESIGEGDYYGFAVDGNHLFLLKNQIVVHNTTTSDVFERWTVNKMAMSTGGGTNIIKRCYSKNPSTVEEMEEGGMSYYKLCQLSAFYERIPTKGQTYSGLARIFFPAYDGLEGYIDKFGKSVIDDPTERQKKLSPHSTFALSGKGAKKTLQDERDALLSKGTPEALEQYRSLRRKHPFCWAECWLGASGNVGFNMEKIDRRIGQLNRAKSFGQTAYKIGNFYWEGGKRDTTVLWQTDTTNGKFKLSLDLPQNLTNLRTQEMGFDASKGEYVPMWKPIGSHKITIGVDPIRIVTKNEAKVSISGSRQSDFGIAGLYEDEKGHQEFILSYRYRPSTLEESMEDTIMAMVYLNAMVYQESNVERLFEYIMQRGYGQYLIWDIDIRTGRMKDRPGAWTSAESKVAYFAAMKDYVEKFADTENHDDILQEVKDIRGMEDMTHRDLFTAACLALMGNQSRFRSIMEISESFDLDLSGFSLFRKRRF